MRSLRWSAHGYLSLRPLPRVRQGHHALWRLHQLKQHAAAAYGRLRVPFGVDEGDVVAGGTATDTAGGEAHALAYRVRVRGLRSWLGLGLGFWSGEVTLQVLNRRGQLVNPEADVVERGHVDPRGALRVERLHQVELDSPRPAAQPQDVLVRVRVRVRVTATSTPPWSAQVRAA